MSSNLAIRLFKVEKTLQPRVYRGAPVPTLVVGGVEPKQPVPPGCREQPLVAELDVLDGVAERVILRFFKLKSKVKSQPSAVESSSSSSIN